MGKSDPVTMLVTYTPKEGQEEALRSMVEQHGPALRKTGLITSEPVRVWKATDKRSGAVRFVEMFQWRDGEASTIAHQTPEIMAVWEPMGPILEDLSLTSIEPLAITE